MEHTAASVPPFRLDPAHPNFIRWQRALDSSVLRGEFVAGILAGAFHRSPLPTSSREGLHGLKVLDLGCGVGGTSIALQRLGAVVTAVDRDPRRLAALNEQCTGLSTHLSDAATLPFECSSFNGVVLQDVIEHVENPGDVLQEIARVLQPGGVFYVSTPNRTAIINVLADPHWGLPFASVMKRSALVRYLRIVRPGDARRPDLAQLLSLRDLLALLSGAGFDGRLMQRRVVNALFRTPEAVVWSNFHLRVVAFMRRTGFDVPVSRLVNDRPGFFNRFVAPSWHLLCRKTAA